MGFKIILSIAVILSYWVSRVSRLRKPSSFGLMVSCDLLTIVYRIKETNAVYIVT